jgi:hypothetical protein
MVNSVLGYEQSRGRLSFVIPQRLEELGLEQKDLAVLAPPGDGEPAS